MKYYAKCSTLQGNITLAVSAEDEEQARKNLYKTYNIVAVLSLTPSDEYNFISQRQQFNNVPNTYRKENKRVFS